MNNEFKYGDIVCVQNDNYDSGRIVVYNDAGVGYYEGYYMKVTACELPDVKDPFYELKDLIEDKIAGIWRASALTPVDTFKINDTVRIKDECLPKPGILFPMAMHQHKGEIVHISEYAQTTKDQIFYYVSENQWVWHKDWLEPVNCIRINDDALSNILSFI